MDDIAKVVCHVTRRRNGRLELLVFDHPTSTDAPVQLPAGTVEPGEALPDAARRELLEETGLDLPPTQWFDTYPHVDRGRRLIRHSFHFDGDAIDAESWKHTITGDGEDAGMIFGCRWMPWDETGPLFGTEHKAAKVLLDRLEHPVRIRPAVEADLPAINDIYNHYVRTSTTTYQETEEPLDGRRAWFANRSPMHPVRVLERGGEVVAWSSLNVFRVRSAYRFTTENSLYVRHDLIGHGLGRMLLADQIDDARQLGHHVIIAGIDSAQAGSIKLHERFGFEPCGTMRETGLKFGRWLDVVFLQKLLPPRENQAGGDVEGAKEIR